jgi:hypothetical protein
MKSILLILGFLGFLVLGGQISGWEPILTYEGSGNV